MGFWHTGYIEHHELDGLADWQPAPPSYRCEQCDAVFDSVELLHRHRFVEHPTAQPALFIRSKQIGNSSIRVTRPLRVDDIEVVACETGAINGTPVAPTDIPERLAAVANDRIHLTLTNGPAYATFDIDVRVASESDLDAVDASFSALVQRRILDRRAIDGFLQNCSHCETASAYCHGITEYLYGVLAIERRDDTWIPYEQYPDRFNEAAALLVDYDRPLAHLVRNLIAFHFNHFAEVMPPISANGLSTAARWFDAVLHDRQYDDKPAARSAHDPTDVLADEETRFIIRMTCTPSRAFPHSRADIEQRLQRGCSGFAKLKLNLLLLRASLAEDDSRRIRNAARSLLNYTESEPLAVRILGGFPSNPNDEDADRGSL